MYKYAYIGKCVIDLLAQQFVATTPRLYFNSCAFKQSSSADKIQQIKQLYTIK